MKALKRVAAMILALLICVQVPCVAQAANSEGVTYSATIDTPAINVSDENQTVVFTVNTNKNIDIESLTAEVKVPEGFSIQSIKNETLGFNNAHVNAAEGMISWFYDYSDGDNANTNTLAVVTIVVPAKTAAGEYEIEFNLIESSKDWGTVWEDGATVSATLTIVDPNAPTETTIVFPCGADGTASHNDGTSATTYTETVNGYTLELKDGTKMYKGARDAKGNGCIKLGTSSKAGSFTFTVPNDVTSVIIDVAAYKANTATVTINGTAYTLAGKSDNGEYDQITVDTSTNKTVSFAVTSGYRAMVNTITYVIAGGGSGETPEVCTHENTDAVPNNNGTHNKVCIACNAVVVANEACSGGEATCTAKAKCALCGGEYGELANHNYVNGTCTACGAKETNFAGRYYIATIRTEGNYWYMTNSLGTASTKRYQAVDSGLTELPEAITAPTADKIFVLEKNEDGTYCIYAEGIEGDDKYLGYTSGNSGTLVAKAFALKLTVDLVDGLYNIHFTGDGERYLSLNATAGNDYFAWYKGTQKQDLALIPVTGEVHTCTGTLTAGQAATCGADGWKDYYTCSCGKLYEDAACATEITDLATWKTGNGKIAATGEHSDAANDGDHKCDNCEYVYSDVCAGGTATCKEQAVCAECGEKYGNLGDHAYGELIEATEAIHTQAELKGAVAAHYFCDVCDTYFTEGKAETTLEALTGEVPVHTAQADDGDCTTDITCACGKVMTAGNEKHTGGEATCTELAKCENCGKEYGELNKDNHKNTNLIGTVFHSVGDGTHYSWNGCSACGEEKVEKVIGTCSGGTATCTEKAVCQICDASYGELKDHSFTQSLRGTLKTAGTCVAEAVYAAKCDNCDFEHETLTVTGEKNPSNHTQAIKYVNKGENHISYYPCCQTEAQGTTEAHTYVNGVCTCQKLASYTISWDIDGNGIVDETTTVEHGTVPTHADGAKAATAEYTYTFTGWNPAVVAATADATYTAQFSKTAKEYTITWIVWDSWNEEVVTSFKVSVAYGATIPAHGYTVPTGWEIVVDEDAPVYSTMPAEDITITIDIYPIESKVTFYDKDGNELINSCFRYGEDYETLAEFIYTNLLDELVPAGYTITGLKYANGTAVEFPYTHGTESLSMTVIWECNHDTTVHKYTYTSNNDGKTHTVKCACGEIIKTEDCSGGTATCTEKAVCTTCKTAYGAEPAGHSFTTKASGTLASAADCDNAATYYVQCDNCDAVDTTKTVAVGNANGHSFSTEWKNDGEKHWHECACGAKNEVAAHSDVTTDTDHKCDVCEKDNVTEHKHNTYGSNETQHWSICDCGQMVGEKADHDFTVGDCICGAEKPETHVCAHYEYKDITETTHQSYCSCGEKIGTAEVHTFNLEGNNKCICGRGREIKLIFVANGNEYPVGVEYGKTITSFPANPTFGKAEFEGWKDANGVDVDGNYIVTKEIYVYAQWKTGWVEIDGEWSYVDPTTGSYATGLQRLPYQTKEKYEGYDEDLAYAEKHNKEFIDKESAWYSFDENGKLEKDFTGIRDGKYFLNGMIPWHPGFVEVDGEWYYFIGDTENGGNKMAEGQIYVTRNAKAAGYETGDQIVFVNGKVDTTVHGIVTKGNVLYYYESGKLMAGAGLVKLEDGYIYVRSGGQVALGNYWVTTKKANGLLEGGKLYDFGTDGYLTIDPNKNGIIDGVYYKEGVPYYAGLIKIGEDYYYVRSDGQIATGKYYITKTNDVEGFYKGMKLFFGEDGKLQPVKNGIVEDGELYYYEDNHLMYGAGLLKLEDGSLIYVRSNGQLAVGKYYITTVNEELQALGYKKGMKLIFGEDGKYFPKN